GRYSPATALVNFFFSSRRRHTRFDCDWSSDVCSSDLGASSPWNSKRRTAKRATSSSDMRSRIGTLSKLLLDSTVRSSSPTSSERSEERRVGKECRARWSQAPEKQSTIRSHEQRGVRVL